MSMMDKNPLRRSPFQAIVVVILILTREKLENTIQLNFILHSIEHVPNIGSIFLDYNQKR